VFGVEIALAVDACKTFSVGLGLRVENINACLCLLALQEPAQLVLLAGLCPHQQRRQQQQQQQRK
jgi:hypothetical protein